MTKEVREGLGLLCLGGICLLVAEAMSIDGSSSDAVTGVVRGAGLLLAIGGLAVLAYAMLSKDRT